MSTSIVEYDYIEGVEDLDDYRPGGYHPIQIDDRLLKRYRIVHKLGHGSFSTVWLALDEQTSKYVAIKVGTADAESQEAGILSQLSEADSASLTPTVIDRFSLDGPNGTHPCYVTEPARCTLVDAREAPGSGLFQLNVARSLVAQLAMAVAHVHSKGFAHGEQLYDKFGAPEPEPVVRLDGEATLGPGVPSHAIPPVRLGITSHELSLNEAKLLLSDFGVAFRPSDESRFESYTPITIRPPEALFEPTTPLSLASDIWSLGCTIFELLAHRSLIDGFLAPPDEITAQQVHLQGRMPSEWWDRLFHEYIQESRKSAGMNVLGEDERAALLELLQWMLAWKPEDRPTAEDVLEVTWMKQWAIPAYEKRRTR